MANQQTDIRSFTTTALDGLLNRLTNRVFVYPATGKLVPRLHSNNEFLALWDTGATNSMITEKVAKRCNLVPTGFIQVSTAGGLIEESPTYLVDAYLPNKVRVENVKVAQGNLGDVDLLIGMDIIALGDFAVTNNNGITTFSFRMPSIERIDFTKPPQYIRATPKTGRNNPCYCGSGKKYKNCHGSIS